MAPTDRRRAVEVGDRAGDAEQPTEAAGRQPGRARDRSGHSLVRTGQPADRPQTDAVEPGVDRSGPPQRDRPDGRDPPGNGGARLGRARSDEFGVRDRRHLDPQVDPIPERAGDTCGVAVDQPRSASTIAARAPRSPARAGVHRRDELEPCREDRRATDPDDRDPTVLEWLTEGLENVPAELGELVEEEHAFVRPGHLTGCQARPAAEHPGVADGVVRCPERPRAHELAQRPVARGRDDGRGDQGLIVTQRRQEAGDRPGKQGLA
jgi:hypothetical protein